MIEVAEGSGSHRTIMKYEKLAFLEFNSIRKRMSVIIRDPQSKKIVLYTKGADSTVKELIRPDTDKKEM
jgi:phospholipid-translocating ATPase